LKTALRIVAVAALLLPLPATAGKAPKPKSQKQGQTQEQQQEPTTIEVKRPQTAVPQSAAPLIEVEGEADLPSALREKKYFYGSFGTRDPFRSLLAGTFEPKLQELLDLHTVRLVGVLWENDEHVAMVQDSQGFGYTLRPGDRVRNGNVVSVNQDAMVARLHVFGQTTRVTLRLQREE
jgi:hypothetical protein